MKMSDIKLQFKKADKSGATIAIVIGEEELSNKLVTINTMMFVAIHELAHLMTKEVGHTKTFWDNMRYLLKVAISLNIYTKQDFNKNPVKYCGTKITDSPLK